MEEEVVWKHLSGRLKNNENRTALELCIGNQIEIYNQFSILSNDNQVYCDNAKINSEIIRYLEMETENIPQNNSLTININVFEQINFNVNIFDKLLKKEIIERIKIINQRIRKIIRNTFILTFTGVFLIAVTQIFQIFKNRYALNELVIIISWVFIWKSVELFFFERIKLLHEIVNFAKIYYSEKKIKIVNNPAAYNQCSKNKSNGI